MLVSLVFVFTRFQHSKLLPIRSEWFNLWKKRENRTLTIFMQSQVGLIWCYIRITVGGFKCSKKLVLMELAVCCLIMDFEGVFYCREAIVIKFWTFREIASKFQMLHTIHTFSRLPTFLYLLNCIFRLARINFNFFFYQKQCVGIYMAWHNAYI